MALKINIRAHKTVFMYGKRSHGHKYCTSVYRTNRLVAVGNSNS